MRHDTKQNDPRTAWAPYEPTRKPPGTCGPRRPPPPPRRLRRDLGRDPARPEGRAPRPASTGCWPARPAPGRRARGVRADRRRCWATPAVASSDPARLKAWWLYRMLFGPDPLGERLTLMWHNHFATSNAQGRRPRRHAAPERDVPPPGPRPVRRAARGDASATRRCWSGSTPRPTARGTPTRTWPAS